MLAFRRVRHRAADRALRAGELREDQAAGDRQAERESEEERLLAAGELHGRPPGVNGASVAAGDGRRVLG